MVWFSAANGRCGFSSALSPCSKFSITGFFSSCLWVIWERWICHFVMCFAMPGPARHGLPLAYSSRGMSCAINVPQAITRTPLSAEKNGRTVFRAGGQHAHGCDLRLARLGACARGRHAEVGVRVHSGMLRRWRPGPLPPSISDRHHHAEPRHGTGFLTAGLLRAFIVPKCKRGASERARIS